MARFTLKAMTACALIANCGRGWISFQRSPFDMEVQAEVAAWRARKSRD